MDSGFRRNDEVMSIRAIVLIVLLAGTTLLGGCATSVPRKAEGAATPLQAPTSPLASSNAVDKLPISLIPEPALVEPKRGTFELRNGAVLVVDNGGRRDEACVGDLMLLEATLAGMSGAVIWGLHRDSAQLREIGLPVFSQGAHPSVLGRRHVPWETDATVACGGAAIVPGDVIVGDDDGVIVIPLALVAEVAAEAAAQEREDAWVFEQVRSGLPVNGLFPPNEAARARYLAETGQADGPATT